MLFKGYANAKKTLSNSCTNAINKRSRCIANALQNANVMETQCKCNENAIPANTMNAKWIQSNAM